MSLESWHDSGELREFLLTPFGLALADASTLLTQERDNVRRSHSSNL